MTCSEKQSLALLRVATKILLARDRGGVINELLAVGRASLGCERLAFYHVTGDVGMRPWEAISGAGGDDSAAGQDASGRMRWELPLVIAGQTVGMLIADTAEQGATDKIPLLKSLMDIAAVALERIEWEASSFHHVSAVSHELRTPLSSMIAFGEMLADGDAGPLSPKQQHYVGRMVASAQQLLRIVEDLQELTRLESGVVQLSRDTVVLGPFLADTALNFLPQSKDRDVRVTVSVADDLPVLTTDQRRLQQALSNLIDNAIRYSPAGGEVRLSAERCAHKLRVSVADEGPGISSADQRHLFEKFFRARRPRDDTEEGSGLGLPIVARLAELLGAAIEVDSCPGKGSTFSLVFEITNDKGELQVVADGAGLADVSTPSKKLP